MKSCEKVKDKKKGKGYSIRWGLAFYLTLFATVVLLITWFFQVVLLDTFFRAIKRTEIKSSAQELCLSLGSAELEEAAFSAAVEHSLGITVYRLSGEETVEVLNMTPAGLPVSGAFPNERIASLYQKAVDEGGFSISRIAFGGYEVEGDPLFDQLFPADREPPRIPIKNIRYIGTQVATGSDGEEYIIFLTAAFQPLDSTVRILGMQYTWIFGIVILVTVLMVYFLYRKISKPIIEMNKAAKQLAAGKYDAEFSGRGYLETRELAEMLNYASCELSRNDRLQKELIANISHDLRTPLTMIKGYGEIMRDVPGENTAENVQVIIDETTRLSELVNDLLDVSRIQSGARTPEKERFDLTAAVREVMTRYEAFTRHRGYDISLRFEGEAFVFADRSMMLQVLYNLINNAINYTGKDHCVRVLQAQMGGRVRISVSDSGEGISPEDMPLIWDRYYKVDKLHRRAEIGTGLGLSIVKEILELHGAAYGVDSTLGQGSTFWFELPIYD